MFLEIKNLEKSFDVGSNKIKVIKDVSLDVERGKMCVMLGPSGSGKSTLLNIIGGIDSADN